MAAFGLRNAVVLQRLSVFTRTQRIPAKQKSLRMKQTSAKLETAELADLDKPIQYSTSKAKDWRVQETFTVQTDYPWYQGPIIIVSVSAFLLYFCMLREENDLDRELGTSIFKRIPGLEEQQLTLNIKYYKEQGKDTSAFEERLFEIQEEKNIAAKSV